MPWRELDHPADIRLEIEAETLEALFRECAEAFYSVSLGMRTESSCGHSPGVVVVQGTGEDLEALLVAWMNELLFELETSRRVFVPLEVRIDEACSILAIGEWVLAPAAGGRVKAVTYGGLSLDPGPPLQLEVIMDV